MRVKLEITIINQENPKINYTVLYNNRLCFINEIAEDITVKDYIDGEEFILDVDFVKSSHVIFIGKTDTTTKLFIHRDIPKILKLIYENTPDYKVAIESIINNTKDFYINSKIEKVYSKPSNDDVVEIINLNIIDNNSLHAKEDRIFNIISSYKSKFKKDIYNLSNSKCNVKAIRGHFKLVSKADYKELFTII